MLAAHNACTPPAPSARSRPDRCTPGGSSSHRGGSRTRCTRERMPDIRCSGSDQCRNSATRAWPLLLLWLEYGGIGWRSIGLLYAAAAHPVLRGLADRVPGPDGPPGCALLARPL